MTVLGPKTGNKIESGDGNIQAGGNVGIEPARHERMLQEARDELRVDLEAKFAEAKRADTAEREVLDLKIEVLQGKIAEYEKRLANPEVAFREFQRTNQDLKLRAFNLMHTRPRKSSSSILAV
ncbi:hypothetical protein SAMN05444000_117102 [Shimia gijangensis]|uniref:Uncharacterized protein n=1 Tax=Shimia gijangensis TaxID=1470563 RepID=A0A1M6P8Q5_9RHOB|nr:hypothetical protein [Shimia gijangensis]SHK04327.1 hypothetical protein SAMN05444000_117102 [Shimia gijangensis]